MKSASDIHLRWVLRDPGGERAIDALGMATQADKIAAKLVPGLSVATNRARYFSFLCWAVQETDGKAASVGAIHPLEATLALEEARRHRGDSAEDCPGVVGRLNAVRYLDDHDWKDPSRPERLYKNTAFATYRPAMRALGLLGRSRRPELTQPGERLAAAFARNRGRSPRCLGDISGPECGLLKGLLGLDYRNSGATGAMSLRRATFEAIRETVASGKSTVSVLEEHDRLGNKPSDVAFTLHRAFVWELLTLGLGLAFSILLVEHRKRDVVSALRKALSGSPRRPALGAYDGGDPDAATYVVGFLRAALRLRPDKLGLDATAIALAQRLVRDRDPAAFLDHVVSRHRLVKLDGPWLGLKGDTVQVLAPKKALATLVRPRTYRLDAYGQILRDLDVLS
jgi:hypothetical protein